MTKQEIMLNEYKNRIEVVDNVLSETRAKLTKAEHDRDRYKAEIERLKAQQREINALQEENKRLDEYVSCTLSAAEFDEEIKQAKIDVLNELKGRLGQVKIDDTKIKFWKVTDMSGTLEQAPIDYKPVNTVIDELIKEIKE